MSDEQQTETSSDTPATTIPEPETVTSAQGDGDDGRATDAEQDASSE